MNWRNAIKLALAVVTVAIMFGAFMPIAEETAEPFVDEAAACNPCDCPEDLRLNCHGPQFFAVYARPRAEDFINPSAYVCEINVYRLREDGTGQFAFTIDRETIDELEANPPEENTLIRSRFDVYFYQLTSGEFQVNAGPDPEGKVYTLIFEGCPAYNIREQAIDPQ